ncbi:DUF3306 domain-containing protein [Halomonas sp. ATCH28]|uniref:DUF3306 domain-containing protein n=1 Tax=Halomonas gemina TaxID=2945105 RepID=A0ABT0SX17_9GAMM|nr:DUF3306 domain-containing protein [Halomonas gemina]
MSRFERWSRLKRGELPASPETPLSPQGSETKESEAPGREPLEPDHPDRASASPAPGSLDHTLPDPDTLPAGSDIKAYLASGVSSGLRKRALRRLFAADHYGIRDGLDDYDHDYREKLQPLAGEVAERLRNWTRQRLDDDEPPEDVPEEVPSEDTAASEEGSPELTSDAPQRTSDTETTGASEALSPETPRSHERKG